MTSGRALLAIIAALLVGCVTGQRFGPDQIVVSDPQGFVRDAQALIQQQPPAAAGDHARIDEAALPASLRIQELAPSRSWFMVASVREAQVASDHLDLVLFRHPDGYGGARVWAARSRPHGDRPTRYKDIDFFLYDKERPDDPENIP